MQCGFGIKILKGKKISFVLYSGSGKAKKATENIFSKFSKAQITYLIEPKKNKEELNKL